MSIQLNIGIAMFLCLIGSGRGATPPSSTKNPPLVIRQSACHFLPPIERRLASLREGYERYASWHNIDLMVQHSSQVATRFAFGSLHGVALEHANDAEWVGDVLYFRENAATAIAELRRLGFHLDRHGNILEARAFEDSDGLAAEVAAVTRGDSDHPRQFFPGARSYLLCGSP